MTLVGLGDPHTARAHEAELRDLRVRLSQLAALAEWMLREALRSVQSGGHGPTERVIGRDREADALQREAEASAVGILLRRQPLSVDLRELVAAIKLSVDLERVADLAVDVARAAAGLERSPGVERAVPVVLRLGETVARQLAEVMDAYAALDDGRAREVWEQDAEIDRTVDSIIRELLTHMMEQPRDIGALSRLITIVRALARVGDHATNIAEALHYVLSGDQVAGERPHGGEAAGDAA